MKLKRKRNKHRNQPRKRSSVFEGMVDMTKHGTAYMICEDLDSDVFVPKKKLLNALHNDRVEVKILNKNKGKYSGEITRIIERNTTHFVGKYQSRDRKSTRLNSS